MNTDSQILEGSNPTWQGTEPATHESGGSAPASRALDTSETPKEARSHGNRRIRHDLGTRRGGTAGRSAWGRGGFPERLAQPRLLTLPIGLRPTLTTMSTERGP